MARLKSHFMTAIAVLYLAGLWAYQLPKSRVEGALMTVFGPIQKITLTDRQYRMYSPNPRPSKRIPFLELKTDLSPVRFLKTPPGRGLGLLPAFSREKWINFVDQLAKALGEGGFFFSEEEGEVIFRRLVERVCKEESTLGDRVKTVTLGSRRVAYGEFRGDIVWDPPRVVESLTCH